MPNDKILQEAYLTIEKLTEKLKSEQKKKDPRLVAEEDRQGLLTAISKDILRVLQPLLTRIADNSKVNGEEIKRAIERAELSVTIDQEKPIVNVNVPDVIVPDFPEIRVPTPIVNYTPPAINIPKIEMPKEMDIRGWVGLMGVSLEKPLPVQLRNVDGSPVNLLENLTTIVSGGGSRGIVKIGGFDHSAYSFVQNGDNRLKVSVETGGSGLTDTELRATAVPVSQVSGASWSTEATQGGSWVVSQVSGATDSVEVKNTVTVSATDLDVRDLVNATDSISVYQVSGASWSVNVGTVTVTATDLDIRDLVNATDSVSSYQVSGANWSVQSSGISRTTNPTAVADGSNVQASYDDLGRTMTRPIQVRDLISTAYVSVTNGTETTLLAGVAGSFLDCIAIMGSNASDAAVSVDIRAVTAGNVVHTIRIPANGTAGWAPAVPWPQDATGNNWTVDGPDETGRTLTFSALFSKEI